MSSYVTFWLKQGDQETCLASYCRSTALYELFSSFYKNEEAIVFHREISLDIKTQIQEQLIDLKDDLKDIDAEISFLASCLNSSIDDKLESYQELVDQKSSINLLIEEYQAAAMFVDFLNEILDNNDDWGEWRNLYFYFD